MSERIIDTASYTTRTADGLRNVHTRVTAGPMSAATQLFESLGSPDDRLWPGDRWPAMELDRGMELGSCGGHGSIRYYVDAVEPGRSVTFRFDPDQGIVGTHSLTIEGLDDGRVRWTHVLEVVKPGRFLTAVLVPLHDTVLEDLLDQAEAEQAGTALVRRPLSLRVKACLTAERLTSGA